MPPGDCAHPIFLPKDAPYGGMGMPSAVLKWAQEKAGELDVLANSTNDVSAQVIGAGLHAARTY